MCSFASLYKMKRDKVNLQRVKRVLLLALSIMNVGTILELYLLSHYETTEQLIPILCIGCIMAMTIVLNFKRTVVIKTIFKCILVITALSGFYGAYLHLVANYEFEQEIKPTATTLDLFLESFSGAFPALAPFSMTVLALIGYSYLILINQK